MKESIKHIKVNEIEYPLVFNLNVMEEIQEEFETFEKWGELTDGKEHEVNMRALKFGIKSMINEGIDIENEKLSNKRDFISDKLVGRLITELGMQNITGKVQETVIDSTKMDIEEKNV